MVTTVPENDDLVLTMMDASINDRKSMKALFAVVAGSLLNQVWASLSAIPRSTNPAIMPCFARLAEQFRVMLLLQRQNSGKVQHMRSCRWYSTTMQSSVTPTQDECAINGHITLVPLAAACVKSPIQSPRYSPVGRNENRHVLDAVRVHL